MLIYPISNACQAIKNVFFLDIQCIYIVKHFKIDIYGKIICSEFL